MPEPSLSSHHPHSVTVVSPKLMDPSAGLGSISGLAHLPTLPLPRNSAKKDITVSDAESSPIAGGSPVRKQSATAPSFLPSLVHSGPLLSSPSPPFSHPSGSQPATKPNRPNVVEVQCKARTRVPTPHGPVFLHIYHNNIDAKEHLAIVVDPAQLDIDPSDPVSSNPERYIRSRSLEARWHEDETEMERLVRGAYVGRLSPTQKTASKAPTSTSAAASSTFPASEWAPPSPIPVVRIHSECYTGETIGSMRCDCGEQLDEAIRYISQPQACPLPSPGSPPPPPSYDPRQLLPGRGAVIYMRQEGRGIGLLEKIKAYNLQDMGADTVAANLMLGHGADERGYDIAAAIMRDLGLDREIRLLTNNPDKMEAVKREGIVVSERLAMVPRTWTTSTQAALSPSSAPQSSEPRKAGATMIGGGAVHGIDLEKYLRTKVMRMGHLLDLPTPANPLPANQEIVLPSSSLPDHGSFEAVESSPVVSTRPLA